MPNNKFDFNEVLYSSPYLNYDDEEILHEWLSIEGAEKINELSRQLRTFLNFKTNLIYIRFSESTISAGYSKSFMFYKLKDKLINSMLELINLLNEIGIESNNISEKIQNFIERSMINPQFSTLEIFKKIKALNHNIWNYIYALSELNIYQNPRFFENVLSTSFIICQVSAPLYFPFRNFYNELKIDYLF